jgi:hypothetical protein
MHYTQTARPTENSVAHNNEVECVWKLGIPFFFNMALAHTVAEPQTCLAQRFMCAHKRLRLSLVHCPTDATLRQTRCACQLQKRLTSTNKEREIEISN